ncbi:aldo/keto reductase [Planktothrix agardhii]|jgi:aryl-alcohol dehydrogenase-like predicted oxidoreductase|uniref:aldo/keto reductase n=1 Tax=Planktothrix agardhii TaxID=1160 RepID=UPI002B20C0BB|nr:aldo/keto reductase [Planktothrix agardhii]MEA5561126.1 aldo/keto reductase [Planktothrix agardhii UHCC 0887]
MKRLALGTVQFGLPYGVANQQGQVSIETATAILDCARANGIDTLDTAIAYGDSEQNLGKIGVDSFRVVSKLSEFPAELNDVSDWVLESVEGSLERLKIPRLHGLLLHRPDQLLSPEGGKLYKAMNLLKEKGLVDKIGISIYHHSELEALFSPFPFDLVQAPFNVLDRSLDRSGWLSRLKEAGVEVHVRSIFLQGLLLMNSSARPPYFERWRLLWEQWEQWLIDSGLTALQACINCVLSKDIDRVVVGVDCLSQLEEILVATAGEWSELPDNLCCDDPDLINPSRWKLK